MLNKDFIDLFLDPLDWDKDFYKFNREEKDMHPYSLKNKDKDTVITHNVLGIDKKDLKLTLKKEKGVHYIYIVGETKDDITGKTYSVSSKFALDEEQLDLDHISSIMRNGLLYITIPNKKEKKIADKNIEIL